jgi:Uma2 family endonuclease
VEGLPESLEDKRYEIIDGELYVSSQPHQHHQRTCTNVVYELDSWSRPDDAGVTLFAPGVIFAEDEAVAPDVIWVRRERYDQISGEDGKFHAAPDLMVEVLSPGASNERRDREVKLGLYSRRAVREYWLLDWRQRWIQVYRRENQALRHVATLVEGDTLESPLLPGFACPVARLFSGVPSLSED